jgi:transforming growth factor-beta-induced protein
MQRVKRVAMLASVAALALAACGDDEPGAETADAGTAAEATAAPETTMAPGTTMGSGSSMNPGTIVDVAVAAGDFTTLVAAVEAAGLVETLSGPGPFTVFAPTDEAFAAALESLGLTAEQLLADTETLTSILTYHVIPAEVPSSAVVTMDGQTATTVNGADVTISVDGDTVMVNDATVTAVDIAASNGIIHVVDSVLLPPAA